MNTMIETLHAIQPTLLKPGITPAQKQAVIENLGAKVPAPILAHFLRLISSGRPGVAVVRHGVCTGCHIRVASATVHNLAEPAEVHLCESCGCYLLLPPDEMPATAPVAAQAPVVVRRKPRVKAVALVQV